MLIRRNRFEALLKLKTLLVRKEQAKLFVLVSEVNEQKKKLKALNQELVETQAEALAQRKWGKMEQQAGNEAYFFALFEKIDAIETTILALFQEVSTHQSRLLEAERRRKVIEKIHKNDYAEWQTARARYENRDFYPRKAEPFATNGSD